MKVDKRYAMSSFLMFRSLLSEKKTFKEDIKPEIAKVDFEREPITTSKELYESLKRQIGESTKDGQAALMLSGGMDSAILAKFMPKGSTAYTFEPTIPGLEVKNEVKAAKKYAEYCGLVHKTIEITWDDYLELIPNLMKHKGSPFHSIEPQIYKAALQAKEDGFEKLIFGEAADAIYGGLSRLLEKDWTYGEFIERYSYVLPYKVLKDWELITGPFKKYEYNGYIRTHEFLNDIFLKESVGSYLNPCSLADIKFIAPYTKTYLSKELDVSRIRKGESKYLIREVFEELYSGFDMPEKLPMPRPVNEWFRDWQGPTRNEFWPNSTVNMTGDQKWLVYILEQYLNMIEDMEEEENEK